MSQWAEHAKFWKSVPPLPTAVFLAAVFCVFGAVGFLSMGVNTEVSSVGTVLLAVIISGGFAVGYGWAGTRRIPKAFFILVPAHVAAITSLSWLGHPGPKNLSVPPALEVKILLVDIGSMVLVIGGYVLFLTFFQMEGKRYFKAYAEVKLAGEIHHALVPSIAIRIGNFELYGVSHPSGEVGGDLVDVITDDTRWFGYVADVSGHGVPAGVLMAMVKSAVRMRWVRGLDNSNLMEPLNSVVRAVKSTEMFVTCAYLQAEGGDSLRFSLAGHPPILHFLAASGTVVEHTVSNFPLGMFAQAEFETARFDCSPGDVLVILTDGFTEVFDRKDIELGLEPVKQALQVSGKEALAEISTRLQETARRHGPQSDDQTLLIVRRAPDGAQKHL